VFKKFATLKSKQTGKYLCYNNFSGHFFLKNVAELDASCVFLYTTKAMNEFSFAVGSNKAVHLSFNKQGRMLNHHLGAGVDQAQCEAGKSNMLFVHTKITDFIPNRYVQVSTHPQQQHQSPQATRPVMTSALLSWANNQKRNDERYIVPMAKPQSRLAYLRVAAEPNVVRYNSMFKLITVPPVTTRTTTTTPVTRTSSSTTAAVSSSRLTNRNMNRMILHYRDYERPAMQRQHFESSTGPVEAISTTVSGRGGGFGGNLFEMNSYKRARKFKKSSDDQQQPRRPRPRRLRNRKKSHDN
jgi:hypothetical protein